ncbi:hypothetical protein [Polymorphobacter sp.]|uniref:hypothetical protein n=1 Tax=Polymorphobacter sp. TaxID=1909290 RepID=UPI003F6F79B2
MTSHKLVTAALAAATLAATLASAANAALVVRSVGTGAAAFPVGRTITAGTPIALKPGDMLTILDGQTTRTFRGPGTFDLGRAAQATTTLASAATALNSRAAERKPRLGTVRGVPAIDSPSLWDIDLDAPATPATQCVVDPATTQLRRTEATAPRTLTIEPASGKPATLTLAAGATSARWPKALPVPGRYTLRSPGQAQTQTLTLTKIPAPTGDATADAETLIKAGCTRQLDRFVATLEK